MHPNAKMLLDACDYLFTGFAAIDDTTVEINIHGARRYAREAADHFRSNRPQNAAESLEAAANRLQLAAQGLRQRVREAA